MMPSEQLPRLREQIDGVAMRLLLEEGDAVSRPVANEEIASLLSAVGECARAEGWQETSRVAAEMAAATPSSAGLRDGLLRLQSALEADSREGRPAEASIPFSRDPELLADFVVEAHEHLSGIERECLAIEQDPRNTDALHGLFRSFHTIKGLAGFLELHRIQEVAHEVESLLDLARNGRLSIGPAIIDVILASADYLSRAVAGMKTTGPGHHAGAAPSGTALLERIRDAAANRNAAPEATPQPAPAAENVASPAAPAARQPETFTVRVDTSKLDYLVDMVGEMVIAQSMVRHDPTLAAATDPNLLRKLAQLDRVTGEVQRTTMSMRMIPIGQLFSRTARIVRDLSRKAGKRTEMETSGETTELDKSIAEELADPLMHMARNSIDHGIEPEPERIAAGKDPVARLRLSAYHEGGQIVVEVSDDGRGLSREKILRKARERGLVDGEVPPDAEIYNLIFEPGFSTAERVTDVSGRGVGMDVVRRHIQKLRGRIDVESSPGRGARFLLKLPLTLAIIDGLVVGVGDSCYIVPIFSVREIFRPTDQNIFTVQGRDEMALVHGRLLPVVRFHRRFGTAARFDNPCEALMIVSENDGHEFCLMVDELLGRQEVVIKSMGEMLRNVPGIAGATILGDGRVGLIVDMDAVFRRSADA
jgi:two-component system chemotaxis sensor kinase CheA